MIDSAGSLPGFAGHPDTCEVLSFMRSWKVWLALVLLSLASLAMTAAPLAPDHGVNTANLDTNLRPLQGLQPVCQWRLDGEKSHSRGLSELGRGK